MSNQTLLIFAGAVVAYLVITRTADKVAAAVNPLSDKNIFYTGLNAATGGSKDQSIGTRLYDWINGAPTFTP